MARKTSITVGLTPETLARVEIARARMQLQAISSSFPMPGSGFSRSMAIDTLLREALERRGIELEGEQCNSNNDVGDSGDAAPGDAADTSGSSS